MSDWFYKLVYALGWPAFAVSSAPVVLHRHRARLQGAYILAATHFSPYDTPCLMKETPRILHFLSIVELFRRQPAAWFLRSIGAVPLDRSRPDSQTVRALLDQLAHGHVVLMYPEGGIRSDDNSVLNGGRLRPGIARLARLGQAPIIPCVIVGTPAYRRWINWLPLRRVRYGVIYGAPLSVAQGADAQVEEQLPALYRALHAELQTALHPSSVS